MWWGLVKVGLGCTVLQQLLVLQGVVHSCGFLRPRTPSAATGARVPEAPTFFVVVPVLREADGLRDSVAHFEAIVAGHDARIVVVTTAREEAEAPNFPELGSTINVAAQLMRDGRIIHLHFPDPRGLKADQVNFAATQCALGSLGGALSREAFCVIYDVDSRPPRDSLARFERAIARHPEASVFHQSSRFVLRGRAPEPESPGARIRRAIADSGALRANRFVMAYELPRLLYRSGALGAWRRHLFSYVYTHVTGHGLCARLSLLQRIPFPARSPLEDMHYSFLLGSLSAYDV